MRTGLKALGVYSALYVLVLYAPIFFIALFAFNAGTAIAFPLKGFTLQWFSQVFAAPALLEALWNSIRVAVTASIVSTILGTLAAKAVSRPSLPGRTIFLALIGLPLLVPGIVVGISLLIVATGFGLELSLSTIVFAHILFCTPFAMMIMLPRFEGMDPSLEEAARDLGEGPLMTFRRVVLPIAAPGIISSLLLTFSVSLDEFVLAFFLAGTDSTLPIFIWSQLRFPNKLPGVLALSTLILAFSFTLVLIAEKLRRSGASAEQA
ncbi:ABC transporter permease [Sinorhizobium sp. BG8]|uniref:ABC transporter permease n=1 Tax=Sinorhizobium sp. BG8 TaxID=2613773 RepID=UPI00193CD07E|nr:ABC transporter permease [Sinorhizobium sp. BG8]QRM55472.1 ABC transporter permease [Sinorhizobium sp. BG8]